MRVEVDQILGSEAGRRRALLDYLSISLQKPKFVGLLLSKSGIFGIVVACMVSDLSGPELRLGLLRRLLCGAPSLRANFPDLPQRLGNCAEDGVVGAVVAITAALQAQMALAVVTGVSPSPLGRLLTIDAAGLRFGGFRLSGGEEPSFHPRFIAGTDISEWAWVADFRAPDEAPFQNS